MPWAVYNCASHSCCCTCHGLVLLTCSDSELTSGTTNTLRHFGRTPLTGDRPIRRSLPTQDSTTQHRETCTYIHASSGIRNHDPTYLVAQDHMHLKPRGHWDRPLHRWPKKSGCFDIKKLHFLYQSTVYSVDIDKINCNSGNEVFHCKHRTNFYSAETICLSIQAVCATHLSSI